MSRCHSLSVLLAAVGALLAGTPAAAHHRQTPAAVLLTPSGDAGLARHAAAGRAGVGATLDGGATVLVVSAFRGTTPRTFAGGTTGDPSLAYNARVIAWTTTGDPFASGLRGTHVVLATRSGIREVIADPSGTSHDPAIDRFATAVAWDSTGDLAGTGNAGARQVFVRDVAGGPVRQVSRGVGTSRHAAVGMRGRIVAFDSTSDAQSGADSGLAQIWVARAATSSSEPITHGDAPSTRPSLSDDGHVLVFQSRADLVGDGHDTGVSQVFAYELVSGTLARLTNDAVDCGDAAVVSIQRDWRVTYRCGGDVYFTQLRGDTRWLVPTGGDTTGILPMTDRNFVYVATTADLVNGGTTPDHHVYLVNLFRRPPISVPSGIVRFQPPGP
jgi:hypothetical protein